jgi:hypothetical protein
MTAAPVRLRSERMPLVLTSVRQLPQTASVQVCALLVVYCFFRPLRPALLPPTFCRPSPGGQQ